MTTTYASNAKVVLNTPHDFDLAQFGAIKNTKHIHKVIWLMHQVNHYTNKEGVLRMHKETYYKFLGLAPKDLNKYLLLLINANLIKQTKVGNNIKECLSEFVMIEPFEPKESTSKQHTYHVNDSKCPLFLKKWVADNHRVKAISTYQKPASKPKKYVTVGADEKDLIIKQQANEIELLKAELAALKALSNNESVAQIKAPEAPKDESNTITSTKEITADNGHKFILENANEYTDEMIQVMKAKYKRTLPMILCDGRAFKIERGVLTERIKESALN